MSVKKGFCKRWYLSEPVRFYDSYAPAQLWIRPALASFRSRRVSALRILTTVSQSLAFADNAVQLVMNSWKGGKPLR